MSAALRSWRNQSLKPWAVSQSQVPGWLTGPRVHKRPRARGTPAPKRKALKVIVSEDGKQLLTAWQAGSKAPSRLLVPHRHAGGPPAFSRRSTLLLGLVFVKVRNHKAFGRSTPTPTSPEALKLLNPSFSLRGDLRRLRPRAGKGDGVCLPWMVGDKTWPGAWQ